MNKEYDLYVVEALKQVRDGFCDDFGICTNVSLVFGRMFEDEEFLLDVVEEYWKNESESLWARWAEFSGDVDFPVPHPDDEDPVWAFNRLPKWSGEYGESRVRLLNWLIEQFELRVA